MAKARAKFVMIERVIDAAVLGIFAFLYSCAVLLLKLRPRKSELPMSALERR
jgi:hypothetical protein